MSGGRRASRVERLELLLVAAVLLWSGIAPARRDLWLLETLPVWAGVPLLLLGWRAFPWTPLACTLITLFALVLCTGGHYTYSHVPLGEWARETFHLSRNHFDRVAHFAQGVVAGVLARELLLRRTPLRRGKALFWIAASIVLAIAATFELLEWRAARLAAPDAGLDALGMQGDPWDAQWDMALALSGAILVQLLFGRLHDGQLAELDGDGVQRT